MFPERQCKSQTQQLQHQCASADPAHHHAHQGRLNRTSNFTLRGCIASNRSPLLPGGRSEYPVSAACTEAVVNQPLNTFRPAMQFSNLTIKDIGALNQVLVSATARNSNKPPKLKSRNRYPQRADGFAKRKNSLLSCNDQSGATYNFATEIVHLLVYGPQNAPGLESFRELSAVLYQRCTWYY